MTQIKDVPGTARRLAQNGIGARAQLFLAGKQQHGLEISLQGALEL